MFIPPSFRTLIKKRTVYAALLPIANRKGVIPPMMNRGSPAAAVGIGVTQITPHPLGHLLPARGQE